MSASIYFIAFISEEPLPQNKEAALALDNFYTLAAETPNVTVLRFPYGTVPCPN